MLFRSAYQLEDKVGIALGPVIVNACYPAIGSLATPASVTAAAAGAVLEPALVDSLEQARQFRQRRHELQEGQITRLAAELPLPQLRVPYLFTDVIGPLELDVLSQALARGIEALHEPEPEMP